MFNSEIGLSVVRRILFFDFGMGTMLVNFHVFGNFVVRERLKSLAKGEAILLAVALSMKADMPSTLAEEVVLNRVGTFLKDASRARKHMRSQ